MPTSRREQVLRLYHSALARDAGERDAFLADACAGDEELRREVDALLAQDPPSDFLGAPAAVPDFALAGAAPAGALTGQHIGPYHVGSRLGTGGMGDVFRAHDTKLGRDVAIGAPRRLLIPCRLGSLRHLQETPTSWRWRSMARRNFSGRFEV